MAIHALLVGIDRYHPDTQIPPLRGCTNDIDAFAALLRNRFAVSDAQLRLLRNEAATRAAIEGAWLDHLCHHPSLCAGDTVLFYFCGHGSRQPTAPAFYDRDTARQDELLVCYDGRLPGNFDLCDKEIAQLLARVPEGITPVLIIDACHSANITRGTGEPLLARVRYTAPDPRPRALSDYRLGDQPLYSPVHTEVPTRAHVVLAACDREQEAWETRDGRGLFSAQLLEHLAAHPTLPSYQALADALRLRIERLTRHRRLQSPVVQGFRYSTRRTFLTHRIPAALPDCLVTETGGKWYLNRGAVHGLPVDQAQAITVSIYAPGTTEEIGIARVHRVALTRSLLAWSGEQADQVYPAQITALPPDVTLLVADDPTRAARIEGYAIPGLRVITTPLSPPDYTLTGTTLRTASDRPIVSGDIDRRTLEQTVQWHRLSRLTGPPRAPLSDRLEVQLHLTRNGKREVAAGQAFSFALDPEEELGFEFRVRHAAARPLYVAALGLSADLAIVVLAPTQKFDSSQDWTLLGDADRTLFLDEGRREVTQAVQLLIADSDFDAAAWQQEGLTAQPVTRGFGKKSPVPAPDWAVRTYTFHLYDQCQSLGSESVSLGRVTLKPHTRLRGTCALTAVESGTRSLHPLAGMRSALPDNFEMLPLVAATTRSTATPAIVALTDLSVTDGDLLDLRSEPLALTVADTADPVLAVTYLEDGTVWPLGQSFTNAAGKQELAIRRLPAETAQLDERKRSLGRALWFCLLKTVRLQHLTFKLRQFTGFDERGAPVRGPIDRRLLRPQGRYLLCIHGIIGDTGSIVAALGDALERGDYDAILTFDYENLNTPIEQIAGALRDRLQTYGFGPADERALDVVVHSMGGLVSRYFIERLQGDTTVDRLLMFGTPNAGSAFGEVPRYRDWLLGLTTLALNTGGRFVPGILPVLSVFEKVLATSKALTVTLRQMQEGGAFIRELNSLAQQRPVSVGYRVVAGDITNYRISADTKLARLLDKLLVQLGDWIYPGANDIAVGTPEILAVAAEKIEIDCHHLNYFVHPQSVALLEAWLTERG